MLEFYQQGHLCPPPCTHYLHIIPLTDTFINASNHIQCTYNPSIVNKKTDARRKQRYQNFQDYLDNLPPLGKHIVNDNRAIYTTAIDLAINITLGNTIWIATDGGAKHDYGLFRWVIANNSFKLWEVKVRAYGNPATMQSLQTENAGLLAAL
eukprot:5104005-Ditylum_brightwellii.AAC.1